MLHKYTSMIGVGGLFHANFSCCMVHVNCLYACYVGDILTNQVALEFSHVLILTMDHFVYSYGEGGRGQLGHNDNVSRCSPKLIESLKEIAVFRYSLDNGFLF